MAAMSFTLNQITMLALTLMVGIVIDDAIVVLENIFRFIEEKGVPPFQAAIEGTKEIGLAVMATTLSLLAVFLGEGGGVLGILGSASSRGPAGRRGAQAGRRVPRGSRRSVGAQFVLL